VFVDMVCGDQLLENPIGIDILVIIQILGALQTFTSSLIVFFFLLNHGTVIAVPRVCRGC